MPRESFGPQRFPSTHWSLIGRAGDGLDEVRQEALNELLRRYWPALKAYLVIKKRISPVDADDLVQGFIQEKVLERHMITVADAARGRFRNLLLTALDNYVVNQWERRAAKKRAAERAVGLNEETGQHWLAEHGTPERAFEVAWGRQVLDEAVSRTKAECETRGRQDLWSVLEQRLLRPILEGCEPASYEELVQRHQFASPTQASNALISAKRMFARNLKAVVGEYASDEADIEVEISELHAVLSRGREHG